MHLRIPLSVAVVGALLVGGAATGTTRAAWTDSVDLAASSMGSGSMGLTAAASAAGLSVPRGGSGTVMVTVTDTSSTAARNLRQRVTPTIGGSLPTGVTATLTTVAAGGCTGTAQGPVDLTPGGSLTTCVTVAATSGTSATSATLTVGVSGAQVRGGTVAGWTTPTQTVTVPVTVPVPATAPVVRCGTELGGTGYSVEWDAVPAATSYRIYQADAQGGPWPTSPLAVGSGLSYSAALPGTVNATRYYRVTAVVAGTESAPSNVLAVRRNGNSANFTCQDHG